MQTNQLETIPGRISAMKEDGHSGNVFLLYTSGVGSEIIAVGRSYEDMWEDLAARHKIPRAEALKQGYVFDVAGTKEALVRVGGKPVADNVFDRMAKARAARGKNRQEQVAA